MQEDAYIPEWPFDVKLLYLLFGLVAVLENELNGVFP